ncbi:MAG TPA: cytochrome c, partial [Acidimicrobiales bacterium]|nr:cytochrome c [Acidimicrobiales bacterium]
TVAGLLLFGAAAACGGGSAGGAAAGGRALFVQSGCGTCHTLRDAGTTGTIGPSLDALKPGRSVVQLFVRRGSGQMPAFENRLSSAQIDELADYVSKVAGSAPAGS